MPPVRLEGINTGLPPNLINKIMEAEREPVRNLGIRKAKSKSRLDLVENLEEKINKTKSSAGSLVSREGFRDLKLESSDPSIVDGTVGSNVDAKGSTSLEVLKLPKRASVITNSFPDKDKTEVGVGYFRFVTPQGKKTVYIDGENNTLEKVVSKINNSRIGIKATLIKDSSDLEFPFRLMIAGLKTGLENNVEYPVLYFLDGDQDIFFEKDSKAENGKVKVEGFEMEVSDNELKNILPGVTLTLKQSVPGKLVHIHVKEDVEEIGKKFKEFVNSINDVFSFIQEQNSLDKDSDTSSTLGGSSLLQSIENRLRRLIQDKQIGIKGKITHLVELGISFNRDGILDFDEKKFQGLVKSDSFSVTQFLFGNGFTVGFVPTLNRELSAITNQAFGPVHMRKKVLKEKIERIDQRIERKKQQLERRETALRRKFSNLEATMARLKSQGNILATLGGGGGGPLSLLNFGGARVSSGVPASRPASGLNKK